MPNGELRCRNGELTCWNGRLAGDAPAPGRGGGKLTTYEYHAVAESGFTHALGDWVFAGALNDPRFGYIEMVEYAARHDIPMRSLSAMREYADDLTSWLHELRGHGLVFTEGGRWVSLATTALAAGATRPPIRLRAAAAV